jgi:hypothetical protein
VRAWHEYAGWALIGVNALAGVWALAAHRYRNLGGRPVWVVIIVGQLLAFVSAFTGVVLVGDEGVELDQFHALYGFSTIIAVGILYSYRTSPFMRDKEYLLYGFGCLFIMGLGIRNLYL